MKRLPLLGLAAILAAAGLGVAADPSAEDTAEVLHTLAAYPKPAREAILDLVGKPDLLKKLDPKGKDAEKVLAGQPEPIQKAARLLLKEPEVLELLQDDPDSYATVAKEFAKDRAKVSGTMDQMEKDDDKATDDWSARLEDDQAAFDQLVQAQAAFAKMSGGAAEDAGISGSGTDINIHSLPTPNFVNYVMANADKYPSLSDTMTSQWLSGKNSAGYDGAFHSWWHNYEGHFHDSLLKHDEHRADRLGELARFDHQHAGVDRSKRYDNFEKHHKENPNLAKLPRHDPNHRPLAHHQKPDHKDGHAAGKNPHKREHKGPRHKAHRKPGSDHHRMHHAKAGHHHHAHHHHHGGKGKKK